MHASIGISVRTHMNFIFCDGRHRCMCKPGSCNVAHAYVCELCEYSNAKENVLQERVLVVVHISNTRVWFLITRTILHVNAILWRVDVELLRLVFSHHFDRTVMRCECYNSNVNACAWDLVRGASLCACRIYDSLSRTRHTWYGTRQRKKFSPLEQYRNVHSGVQNWIFSRVYLPRYVHAVVLFVEACEVLIREEKGTCAARHEIRLPSCCLACGIS
jgi:hypothetical protein